MFAKGRKLKHLDVKFYAEDHRKLQDLAAKEGMTLATWVRVKLLEFLNGRSFSED
jgi:hypothetical protein